MCVNLLAGLILVKEPYYNEAGFEKQRGSQHGKENSRMYNEMAVLKLIQVCNYACLNIETNLLLYKFEHELGSDFHLL